MALLPSGRVVFVMPLLLVAAVAAVAVTSPAAGLDLERWAREGCHRGRSSSHEAPSPAPAVEPPSTPGLHPTPAPGTAPAAAPAPAPDAADHSDGAAAAPLAWPAVLLGAAAVMIV
ncbi:hypothetical protein BS78_09G160400 [Paspalum vaginatum]|nr:hypothetical protein BS78_09G160400 [Paspalum vaginatum]